MAREQPISSATSLPRKRSGSSWGIVRISVYSSHCMLLYIVLENSRICLEMDENYGLAGFPDENGDLGRPVPAEQIVVPEMISLKDNAIHWKMGRPRIR